MKKKTYKKVIFTALGLLFGITLYLVGMSIAGYNVIGWFWNKTAWLVYLLLAIGGLTGAFLWKITKKE